MVQDDLLTTKPGDRNPEHAKGSRIILIAFYMQSDAVTGPPCADVDGIETRWERTPGDFSDDRDTRPPWHVVLRGSELRAVVDGQVMDDGG